MSVCDLGMEESGDPHTPEHCIPSSLVSSSDCLESSQSSYRQLITCEKLDTFSSFGDSIELKLFVNGIYNLSISFD